MRELEFSKEVETVQEIELAESSSAPKEIPQTVEVSAQMKALDRAFNKKFGDKYYGIGKEDQQRKTSDLRVEFISTGCYSLDYVLGGGGPNFGIPVGRVVQMYGASSSSKTLTSTHIASTFQKLGKRVAFIDAEHSMDPAFATMCGLNVDDLILFKPSTCEEAMEALREFTKSGVIDLVILDSTASLSPQSVQDKNVGEATMAVAARYWSTLLPELVVHADTNKCTVILLNQVRTNLGSYGCFHEETPIRFADGSTHLIREVVEQKLVGPILSYNLEDKKFESKNILNWYTNGKLESDEEWLTITLNNAAGKFAGDLTSFTCTPNHQILLGEDYVDAESLKVGDELTIPFSNYLDSNDIYKGIVYGSLLGDGGIVRSGGSNGHSFNLCNNEQPEYLQWKLDKLKDLSFTTHEGNCPTYRSSKLSNELKYLKEDFYLGRKKTVKSGLKLTPLMAAVWFMDDGSGDFKDYHCRLSLSVRRWANQTELTKFQVLISEFLRIKVEEVKGYKSGKLILSAEHSRLFADKVKEFVIPSMQYKLPAEYRGFYKDFDSGELSESFVPVLSSIRKIERTKRKMRAKTKYDLQIEDNSNYLVGGYKGAVVHNSPVTAAGGKALGFYSSIILKLTRSNVIKIKGEEVGISVNLSTTKNKVATPFKSKEISVFFPHVNKDGEMVAGIDVLSDVVEAALDLGVFEKAGAWLEFEGLRVNGKEAMKLALEENPDVYELLKNRIKE